jgi:hypothetical protein
MLGSYKVVNTTWVIEEHHLRIMAVNGVKS